MLGDFSRQAKTYAQSRPGYPAEMIDLLLKEAGVRAGDAVAEIGAGTGIFTRLLSERNLLITAIEPNDAMRQEAEPMAGVQWTSGTFESSGLPTASQDWIVAAQAFHWADPKRTLPEMRRILKPHRPFTVLWNNRQNHESEVLEYTVEAIHRYVPEFDDNYRQRSWGEVLKSSGDFSRATRHAVLHIVRMPQRRYLDLWRSHNRLTTTAGPERFAVLMRDIQEFLLQRNLTVIEVPYLCESWTAW